HRLPTTSVKEPVTIKLAAKGSYTKATAITEVDIEIAPGRKVKTILHISPLNCYDAILGMPFMEEHRATLDVADNSIRLPLYNYTISCHSVAPQIPTSAATDIADAADSMSEVGSHTSAENPSPEDEATTALTTRSTSYLKEMESLKSPQQRITKHKTAFHQTAPDEESTPSEAI